MLSRLIRQRAAPGDRAAGGAALRGLLRDHDVDPRRVVGLLDGLDHEGRLAAIDALGFAEQRRLFDAAQGLFDLTIDHLVPPARGVHATVRHHGKNSMLAFTRFEKRMLRPLAGGSELWGYNHQTMAPVSGPGYFVAYDDPGRGEVTIDYTRVPAERPAGWPPVRPNERGLSTLIYGNMIDVLRGVTAEVTVGRAYWKGVPQPNYFVLCRQ